MNAVHPPKDFDHIHAELFDQGPRFVIARMHRQLAKIRILDKPAVNIPLLVGPVETGLDQEPRRSHKQEHIACADTKPVHVGSIRFEQGGQRFDGLERF